MKLSAASLVAMAVASGGLAVAAFAQTPTEISRLSEPGGTVIEGQVTDVFGNKFVLQDKSGKILVETGPHWHTRLDVKTGETLSVTGERDRGGSFDAFSIKRGDGTTIEIRRPDGPPPWARGPRKEGKGERGAMGGMAPLAEPAVRAAVEKAGYTYQGIAAQKKKHYEVTAKNRAGEDVELHVDFGGTIYKEERRFAGR